MAEEKHIPAVNHLDIHSRHENHFNTPSHLRSFIYKIDTYGNIAQAAGDGWVHLGLSENEPVGANAYKLFSYDESFYSENLKSGYFRFESTVKIDKTERHFEHIVVQDMLSGNELLCLSTDISRLRSKEKQLADGRKVNEDSIALLQQKNDHKDKILSIVAHDLRSPLASLTALLSVLDTDGLPEEMLVARKMLEKQLNAVTELLNNLLNWASRSFYDEALVIKRPVNIYKAVQHNIELISNTLKEKKIDVVNDIPGPFWANVNPDQVDIVIRNILLNAVKFTPVKGKITLSGGLTGNSAVLVVTDTGVGMTPEQLNVIFTPVHIGTHGTLGEKGFGLGLLLCKEYVDANNGSISVTSKVNAGTAIRITFPAAHH